MDPDNLEARTAKRHFVLSCPVREKNSKIKHHCNDDITKPGRGDNLFFSKTKDMN